MNELFLKIINMSISASWPVLAVLILRLVLKKAPKWVNVLLWGIVAIRLICPFSIESPVSLIPDSVGNGELVSEWMDDYIGEVSIFHDNSINYAAAVAAGREPISDGSGGYYVVTKNDRVSEPSTIENAVMPVLTIIWTTCMVLLALYTAVSYWRLRRKVDTAVLYKNNIFQSENVSSPFVLGIIKPRIYLPFKMDGQDLEYVVAHEMAHIRRKDHWWKPLGFLLLTIHWFNPLMWLAYVLLCRDIELACDEKVIKELGSRQRADYAQALVACSVDRRMIAACPLAFGEVGVKERVESVMNYKKPAFWMIALAVVVCAAVAVCFLTDPVGFRSDAASNTTVSAEGNTNDVSELLVTKWFDYLDSPYAMPWDGRLEINIPEFPDVTFRWYPERIEAVTRDEIIPLYSGMPIWNTYFYDITGDGLPELCSSISFGSGAVDNRIIIYDYANDVSYSLVDRMTYDYTLRLNGSDGQLYVDKRSYIGGGLLSSGRLVFEDNCIQILGYVTETASITDIVDPTKTENFAYDTAVEKFFEDEINEYYFGGIYSRYVIVRYVDGTQEDIVTALNAGRATVADLDRFGIRYWAEPKNE